MTLATPPTRQPGWRRSECWLSFIADRERAAVGVHTERLACRGDLGGSVACCAGEPAGQGEDVLGELGRIEDLKFGAKDGHIDGEYVG